MTYWHGKRVVVTGGSAGLGRVVAEEFASRGARVAIVARGQVQLQSTAEALRSKSSNVLPITADVTRADDVKRLVSTIQSAWGGIDCLCQCAGRSMRGTILDTPPDEFQIMWEANFLATLRCTQAFAQSLKASRGHLILIGSLASKTATAYMGAYPASKFPVAALAQQLRLELGDQLHVLLVCPGPVARPGEDDSTDRYAEQSASLPASARRPGGGAKVRAIDPHKLAEQILRACQSRQPELIVPGRARLLFALAQLSPRLGDWLLRKMTS